MAGTCDDATPAMILATFRPRLAATLRSGFRFDGFGLGGFRLRRFRRRLVAPRLAAIAFHRPAAAQHHLGIVVLRGARHGGGKMAERMAVGGAELGGEIDVAAELEQPVVFAIEDGGGLFGRERELLQVFGLVRLEGLAVLVLHQRHAEHVDAVSLARPLRVEHEGAGDIVIVVLRAWHRRHLHSFRRFNGSHIIAKQPVYSTPSLRAKRSNLTPRMVVVRDCFGVLRTPRNDWARSNIAASGCRSAAASAGPRSARSWGSCRPGGRRPAPPWACWGAASRCPRARGRGSARPRPDRRARRRHRAGPQG